MCLCVPSVLIIKHVLFPSLPPCLPLSITPSLPPSLSLSLPLTLSNVIEKCISHSPLMTLRYQVIEETHASASCTGSLALPDARDRLAAAREFVLCVCVCVCARVCVSVCVCGYEPLCYLVSLVSVSITTTNLWKHSFTTHVCLWCCSLVYSTLLFC